MTNVNSPDYAGRLDRIESKIDQLSEAMISLARVEEKMIAIEKNYSNMYERLNRHSEKLDSVEEELAHVIAKVDFLNKALFVSFAALITTVISYFFQ